MSRRLYVYYRVAEADLGAVASAVRQCQSALMLDDAHLHCELLRRPDLREGQVTLMEIYRSAVGVDNAQQTRIDAAIGQLNLALASPRHTEVFEDIR